MVTIKSKLPSEGTTIFTVISKLASDNNAINLGQGFPDFDCDDKLKNFVNNYLNSGKNQYCPLAGHPKLTATLCSKIERTYGYRPNQDREICVTAGATQALFTAITAFINKGDEVIVFEPAYDCYKPQVALAGGTVVPYMMRYPDYRIDWNLVGEMINEKTRMIIINSPHNPSGTVLEKSDMLALESLVQNKNIIVLSDEVYEHLIFDGKDHQSVLRYPNLFQQSMAVFSLGKTLHATGWKIGYIVGPEKLMNAYKNVHQWNVFCVSSFVQFGIADYLDDSDHYEYLPQFFEAKRNYMLEKFRETPFTSSKSDGTYFQLYNYSEVSDMNDMDFASYLTAEIGVACIPISPFYTSPPEDKVVRFCFAKNETTIDAAAEKLRQL